MTGKNDKKLVRQPSSSISLHQWDTTRTTSVSTSLGALPSWTSSPRRSPRPEKQAFVPLLPSARRCTTRPEEPSQGLLLLPARHSIMWPEKLAFGLLPTSRCNKMRPEKPGYAPWLTRNLCHTRPPRRIISTPTRASAGRTCSVHSSMGPRQASGDLAF